MSKLTLMEIHRLENVLIKKSIEVEQKLNRMGVRFKLEGKIQHAETCWRALKKLGLNKY